MRIALVVAMLLLLCGVGICAESHPPSPSKGEVGSQKQENTSHINNNPDYLKQASVSRSVIPIETRNPETQITQHQKDDNSPSEWWLIGLTAVLSLATIWLVVETRRLATEANITSKRQAIETKDALDISRQAAEAAQKSAEVAENALTLLERPYVFAFGVSQFQLCTDRLEPVLSYEVANFGKR